MPFTPDALDPEDVIVTSDDIQTTSDAAPDTNSLMVFYLCIASPICTYSVDKSTGWTDLNTGSTRNAGTFTQRYAEVGD